MSYFAHETAVIDEGANIGEGTKIWHFSHIMPGCKIGELCNIGQNVVINPNSAVNRRGQYAETLVRRGGFYRSTKNSCLIMSGPGGKELIAPLRWKTEK